MAPTRTIARIAGPSVLAIALTETYNAHIFAGNPPTTVYLNGTILFIAGLAIVQSHKVWALRPAVSVTILGWSAMSMGLARMVFPEYARVDPQGGWPALVAMGSLCLAGAGLCIMGYS